MKIEIVLENCGRFFDDYTVLRDGKLVTIVARAEQIPRKLVHAWVAQIRASKILTSNQAATLLSLAAELIPTVERGDKLMATTKKTTKKSKSTKRNSR